MLTPVLYFYRGDKMRAKEIIYFALSRLLDDPDLSQEEFNEIDTLRDEFNPN